MTRRGLPRFMQLASISLSFSLPCGIDLVLPSSSSHPTLILSLRVAPCYGETRGRPRNTARVYVKTRLIFLLIFSSQTIVPLPFSCVRTHTRGEKWLNRKEQKERQKKSWRSNAMKENKTEKEIFSSLLSVSDRHCFFALCLVDS